MGANLFFLTLYHWSLVNQTLTDTYILEVSRRAKTALCRRGI